MNQAKRIKSTLNKCIKNVCAEKERYCVNPERDFSHNKKLPMDKVIKTVLGFSSKSLTNEMIDIFSGNTSFASASALIQQRAKLLPSAFEAVFKNFSDTMNPIKLFEGYRLLAVDGSDISTPPNPNDKDSYFKQGEAKPYALYHLNALYDLCSHTYTDAVVQKRRNANERKAFCDMVDRYCSSLSTIFIADLLEKLSHIHIPLFLISCFRWLLRMLCLLPHRKRKARRLPLRHEHRN